MTRVASFAILDFGLIFFVDEMIVRQDFYLLSRDLFGGMTELKNQNARVGGVAVLSREERFVYYLITKEHYYDKPTYQTLHQSLEAMRDHIMLNDVKVLAMPKIGCGLDGLQWPKVKDLIVEVFQHCELQINVWTFR